MVMEMGQHALKTWPEPLQLYQVLVPGLEDRALLFPNLTTFEQITPGPPLPGHLRATTHLQTCNNRVAGGCGGHCCG